MQVSSVITSLQSLSSLQVCWLTSHADEMTSFNNMLSSLPIGIQALKLKNCPLRKSARFLPALRRFTHLRGLEISNDVDVEKNHQISLSDIHSLAKHPPVSLQWFEVLDDVIDVMQADP